MSELHKSDTKETEERDPFAQPLISGLESIIAPTSDGGVGNDPHVLDPLIMYLTLDVHKSDSKDTKECDPHAQPLVSGLENIIAPTSVGGIGNDPNVSDPFIRFLTLDAGNSLVNQFSRMVFNFPGDEALRAIVETFFINVTWVRVFVRHNYTTTPIQESVRVLTRRTIVTGSETNRELKIGASYNGLSIGFANSRKTFSSNETVSEREITASYTIPPQSSLHVYQRRYRFRDEVWWIADAWRELWNVCKPGGGYTLLRVPFDSFIDSDERMAINVPLTGTQRVPVSPFSPTHHPWRQRNRQFVNHTSRTRNAVTRVINDSTTGRSLEEFN